MILLIGNIGSTSLKTRIVKIRENQSLEILGEANLDRIREKGESTFQSGIKESYNSREKVTIQGFKEGIEFILRWYLKNQVIPNLSSINGMGFKCVMGESNGAHLLTEEILNEMQSLSFVAPVHNLPYIQAIRIFREVTDIPMVGVFEPSFHYSVPEYKKYLGLPFEWHNLGIKKLGFHGASHRYLASEGARILENKKHRIVTVHLGGSSSICAVVDGKSYDIDQHFSPNSGLLQGTRTGDTDPGALLFAMKKLKLTVDEAQEQISFRAGIQSVAGLNTTDMREIQKEAEGGNAQARMALDNYVDGIKKHIAGFAASMGGLDLLIFSGGIGENNFQIRESTCEGMEFMGINLDKNLNKKALGFRAEISARKNSKVKIWVVPSNEEYVVAWFTREVIEKGRDLRPDEMEFRTHQYL